MPDFGTDISDFPDLDPMMPEITGRVVVLEAIYRRLSTPRGSLFYDLDYGYSLLDLLGEGIDIRTLPIIETEIARECQKDERVTSAQVKCTYNSLTQSLNVAIVLQDGDGPFALVLSVDQVSVEVLQAG